MNALKKKEISKKLLLALDLFSAGCEMMKKNLKRKHPDASDEDIAKMHDEWLFTRPGAEFGDAAGPPGTRHF